MTYETYFLCESTLDGIFTGIYDAWASGIKPEELKLVLKESYEPELFKNYVEVEPDREKAEKVGRTIKRKISTEAFRHIYHTVMSFEEDRADAIYRFLKLGFFHGENTLRMLQRPEVMRLFQISRSVENEAHRFLQFLRFEQLENDILFARLLPKSRVVTLIADHFYDRFRSENWVIYDEKHKEAAIHPSGRMWSLTSVEPEYADLFLEKNGRDDAYEELWKTFFHATAITERRNLKCQKNFMPLWYRTYMTEFKQEQ